MSISGVGAYGSAGLDQILSRMLSRLDSTSATTSNTSSNSGTTNAEAASPAAESAAPAALSGTGQSALSDQIMAVLVQLQQQSAAQGTQSGTNPAGSPTAPANANDPVQQLFSAMDTNGDGTVSEAEMEGYVEGKGGTQAQADALFSKLNQNAGAQSASTGISEQQMGADISQVQHSGHRHHHHHGGSAMSQPGQNSTTDIASQIFSALDGNQDGAVSADEFSTAFAANSATSGTGTSSNDPSALFAQIDGNKDGSVTTDELGNFFTSLAKQVQSDFSTLGAFGQLAVQSYDASSSLLDKTSSGQSSYA